MDVLPTQISADSPAFGENRAAMQAFVHQLRERLRGVLEGGDAASRAKHTARGKLSRGTASSGSSTLERRSWS